MKSPYELSEEIVDIVMSNLNSCLPEITDITIEGMRQEIQWCIEDSDK